MVPSVKHTIKRINVNEVFPLSFRWMLFCIVSIYFLCLWRHNSTMYVKRPTNALGSSGIFLLLIRHGCLISTQVVFCVMGMCGLWPVPCGQLTPWGWQPYAETCWGRIWNILIKKIHYFLEHLLVFLHTILQDARFNHQDSTIHYTHTHQPTITFHHNSRRNGRQLTL
jgi:hypothetical protein